MAIHDFKSQRLFVEDDLTNGKTFEATREQANYLLNVLRLKDGEQILVFNGRDGEWQVEIKASGRKKCELRPTCQIRTQPEPYSLVYCFAPLKQARLDYMIQKAVEMGVGVLQPVITQFTQVRTINEKRIRANAIEAAEQCGIINLPEIREPIKLEAIGQFVSAEATLYFCDETANQSRTSSADQASRETRNILLIGPEGGFSDEERKLIDTFPNLVRLGLGPRILRADTAAIAALSIIQAQFGDWYET
ncbi:MAG: 16S rRNA (uracil(1498)-N(3))-methyltransferase [Pseudomonadota bacterium]